jgi:hypothetical protein
MTNRPHAPFGSQDSFRDTFGEEILDRGTHVRTPTHASERDQMNFI